ncbi:hypothetical protein, partial [Dietzia sp. SYD-A1]
ASSGGAQPREGQRVRADCRPRRCGSRIVRARLSMATLRLMRRARGCERRQRVPDGYSEGQF